MGDTVARNMLAEYGSTCDQSRKMLTYFKQSASEVYNTDFSDQVMSFLNVICQFLAMLKSAVKEVQDRRQFNLARGLPDLISVACDTEVDDLKFAGDIDEMTIISKRNMIKQRLAKRNTIKQRYANSKSVSAETLSLSGVSGPWKEQLQTRRIARALILSTAQQCIEKLTIQRFVRYVVVKAEVRLCGSNPSLTLKRLFGGNTTSTLP